MPASLRGYTQAVYDADGQQTIAWPSGSAVGDYAVLCCLEPQSGTPNSRPADTTNWLVGPSTGNSTVWGAYLTADLLAAALPVQGFVAFLAVIAGCGGIGRTSKSNGVSFSTAGSGLFVFVRDDTRTSTLTPATGKLGTDVLNGANRNRRSNVWFIPYTTTGTKKLSSTNATYFTSLEMLPAVAPSAPTAVTPVAGALIDPSMSNTFTVRHNHPSMPQTRINLRIRVKTGPGAWQYLSGGTLSGTSTPTSTSTSALTLNASQLTTNTTYEWQAQTAVDDSGSGLWSDWSALSEVTAAAPPVVNSVSVSSPAGDLHPDVTATRTLGYGSQVAWQVRVTPSASASSDVGTLYESAVQPGADLAWTLDGIDWTNGSSYKAWVRIQQTGGQWSAWASGTFTPSWTAPGAASAITWTQGQPPTVTVTGLSGKIRVQVATSADGGTTWSTLMTTPVTAASMTIGLPLAPYGVALKYRARASGTVDSTEVWSAWVTTASSYTSADDRSYLTSDDASSWVQVRMRAEQRRRVEPITVSYGLTGEDDTPTAVVDYGPTQGWAGSVTLLGLTPAEVAAVVAFFDANDVFRIRWQAERYGTTVYDMGNTRAARASAVEPGRLVQTAITPRELPFDWVEQ